MIKYSPSHEWIRVNGSKATVGISTYAQEQLGDVVFVDLPAVGKAFKKGDQFAVVESVKAASEVYMPVSGKVTAINSALSGAPETVNKDPEKNGWFVEIELSDKTELDNLLDEKAYQATL